ncbi:hypothetical protein CY0110_16092 [Crocosphaera chwakensis CCY0110]|uniref:Uncharacterized protein n=1 Tax=Crocosphaera chwakensis CCY0110 TaxID=391612 RepID=A3IHQ0_9CHRO|nr:hypothetical protein CY0110_16092 [Crocosphaera chwakensis CCY0110]
MVSALTSVLIPHSVLKPILSSRRGRRQKGFNALSY